MEEHGHQIPFLREAVIFLVAGGLVVPLIHQFRVSPVLGYLIVGALIGPFGLGLLADDLPWLSYIVISDVEGVKPLAELGVIFLLFVIGLELSLKRLWAMRRMVFGLGGLQVLISGTIIGGLAWGWGNAPRASIVLGACLALSSTAIVMQLLMERRRLGTPLGRASFSVLLFQDLAVVPILFLVGVFGTQAQGGAGAAGLGLLLAVAQAAAVIGVLYLIGYFALRPLFTLVSRAESPEMFMAAILLVVIGTSAVTGMAGLSMALGAFLVGLLLADSEFRHEIEVDIEPFKGLLLGLFFMTVGMGVDFRVIFAEPFWVLASVAGLFLIKSLVTGGLCLAFGIPRHVAFEAGLLLGQGGEFAFVVVGLAQSLGLIPGQAAQFMLIVAGLSMVVTPFVAGAGRRLANRLEDRDEQRRHVGDLEELSELEGHVIIAGFGRVGQTMARLMDREKIEFVALDASGASVAEQHKAGFPVFYGDASRPEMLRKARPETAAALVVTLDNPAASERVVRIARRFNPDLPIYARARDRSHARGLLGQGANDVVPETIEASLQLAFHLLVGLGTTETVALKRIEAERDEAMAALRD